MTSKTSNPHVDSIQALLAQTSTLTMAERLKAHSTLALVHEQQQTRLTQEATNTLLAGLLVTAAGKATDSDIGGWAEDARHDIHFRLAGDNLWRSLDSKYQARQKKAAS